MGTFLRLATFAAAGAAVMFYFDPEAGRRRRAMMRDKLTSTSREAAEAAQATARRVTDRARGLVHEGTSRLDGSALPRSDEQLRERIRSRLGHLSSHPGAIEVVVEQGRVRLEGPILAREVERVVDEIRRMPGVESVDNQLSVHEQPGNIPALQGGDQVQAGSMGRS
jgi:osmotically-inducible protein OsmY